MKGLFTAVLAAALVFLAPAAPAQALPGDRLLETLAQISPQLNLNTLQQQQWERVLAQGQAARDAARANIAQVISALRTELSKPEPDLAAVAALGDEVRQQNEALHRQARDAWLALYSGFTPEQKAVVRDSIKTGLDRMQARRSMQRPVTSGN